MSKRTPNRRTGWALAAVAGAILATLAASVPAQVVDYPPNLTVGGLGFCKGTAAQQGNVIIVGANNNWCAGGFGVGSSIPCAAGLGQKAFAGWMNGAPLASTTVEFTNPYPLTIPANLLGSVCSADTAATATATIDFQVNGSHYAYFSFAGGATVATRPTKALGELYPGDVVGLVAQATPDATLANVHCTVLTSLRCTQTLPTPTVTPTPTATPT